MIALDFLKSLDGISFGTDTPTRCTRSVTVNVKETVSTGALSGSMK